ncbi:MAG: hypothetical protein OQK25_04705, partial [Gammaproteobacteria bacterium]|nr:hypothetical protein [Gammaproteobacteria bacterium]
MSFLKLKLFMFSLMICCTFISINSYAEDGDDVVKVVYHADFSDPRRFSAMPTSINNMVSHYENEMIEYDVRIV